MIKISVHWYDPENPQKYPRQTTIKHSRAFCNCSDGFHCSTQAKPPKREVRNKNLERRQKDFDSSGGGRSSGKGVHFRHRPGSGKGQKGYSK